MRRHSFVLFLCMLVTAGPLLCQERAVFGARSGTVSVLSDSSSSEAVWTAEFIRGLERTAKSLALAVSDKPLTIILLENEADLAQIDPALISEVPSRRYLAEDEAFIVVRHNVRRKEELLASEYARFLLHEAMWSPPAWLERGFAAFFVDSVLKENGADLLARTCDAGFLGRLRSRLSVAREVDVPANVATNALIARFGLAGAIAKVAEMQSASDPNAFIGAALATQCRAFDPAGEPLRIPEGTAEVVVRKRRDLLDRIASLQLRTREGAATGIRYYEHQLSSGRETAIVYREIGIGHALRAENGLAISFLAKALRANPSDFATNLYLGVQCAYDSDCDVGALPLNLQVLERHALNPFVQYIFAQRGLAANRKVEAMLAIDRAVLLRPSDANLRRARAGIAIIAGNLDAAETDIARLSASADSSDREAAAELERVLRRQSERVAISASAASASSQIAGAE